jgi:hypothetical protein
MISAVTSLQPVEAKRLRQVLSTHRCCRCMQQLTTRSALLQHLEARTGDCAVVADLGGVDVPRQTLIQMCQKRTQVRR